jgi:hypothetical protein
MILWLSVIAAVLVITTVCLAFGIVPARTAWHMDNPFGKDD